MLKLIGLSGGPGNGKSAVAEFFRKEGICVIDADKVCHAIYQEKDNRVLSAMRERWGKDIFDSEGFIDRKKIAEIVFRDDGERKFLDALLHPEIFRRINEILEKEKGSLAILEAALLFESSWADRMFRTITVWAGEEIRMQRLLARNWTKEHALKRIQSQMPDSLKVEKADYVIINNGTLEELYNQCRKLLAVLIQEVNEEAEK
ncbi:MAG: dephospho-CoA kinase [Lentisphaeria bacterium]|nr:dephospho-CoA kinase [Lentisphaeria bacterium]